MSRIALILVSALVLIASFACGGDDDDGGNGTAVPTNPDLGPAAQLPMHIESVTPAHGQTISNADLSIGQADATSGICASFDFAAGAGMGDTPIDLVHLFLNTEDISGSIHWVVTDNIPTSSGTGCYAPPEDLVPGVAEGRVRYADSTGRQFEYNWKFEITD